MTPNHGNICHYAISFLCGNQCKGEQEFTFVIFMYFFHLIFIGLEMGSMSTMGSLTFEHAPEIHCMI